MQPSVFLSNLKAASKNSGTFDKKGRFATQHSFRPSPLISTLILCLTNEQKKKTEKKRNFEITDLQSYNYTLIKDY